MVFNKILFFSCSSPLFILSNNILGKEALVNIDNSKKPTTWSTKQLSFEKVLYTATCFSKCSFSSQIYLRAIFYIA